MICVDLGEPLHAEQRRRLRVTRPLYLYQVHREYKGLYHCRTIASGYRKRRALPAHNTQRP